MKNVAERVQLKQNQLWPLIGGAVILSSLAACSSPAKNSPRPSETANSLKPSTILDCQFGIVPDKKLGKSGEIDANADITISVGSNFHTIKFEGITYSWGDSSAETVDTEAGTIDHHYSVDGMYSVEAIRTFVVDNVSKQIECDDYYGIDVTKSGAEVDTIVMP